MIVDGLFCALSRADVAVELERAVGLERVVVEAHIVCDR